MCGARGATTDVDEREGAAGQKREGPGAQESPHMTAVGCA